ncbi:MAG: CADD family putative folate metabolism protein [Pseudanabaenaceae cyanobacterium]
MDYLIHVIDAQIEAFHLLKHPFYQAWNEGKLSLEMLKNYAKEYYQQVHYFPTYVSAVHSACSDLEIRQMLLDNLIEEEKGSANHPELWLRFAEGLGVPRAEVLNHLPLATTLASVQELRALARNENPLCGLVALYAYESQVPRVATTKIAGLKEFYGIKDDRTLSFFLVHQQADVIHSQQTREAIVQLAGASSETEVLSWVKQAMVAMNLLLDGVYSQYCQELD